MYDAHHRRLARLYIVVLLFFLGALGAFIYIAPAQSTSELEARLGGSLNVRSVYEPQYIAAIAQPAVVRITADLVGTLKFPDISVDEQGEDLVVSVGDDGAANELEIDEYVRQGSGVFVGDGYIATNAHVVSSEWVLTEIYYGLVDDALEQYLATFDDLDEALDLEAAYYTGEFDEQVNAAYLVFLNRLESDFTETITVSGEIGSDVPASIIASFENIEATQKDVALLSVSSVDTPSVLLGLGESDIAVGSRVYSSGFPFTAEISPLSEAEPTFSQGVLNAYKEIAPGFFVYQTDVRTSAQSSGSPLFNDEAEVVGLITINTADLTVEGLGDAFSFAIPSEHILELADSVGVTLGLSDTASSLYGGFAELGRGDCSGALDFFESVNYAHIDPFFNACVDNLSANAGFLAQIQNRIDTTDRLVLIVLGTLSLFIFVLFLLLVYLRSRIHHEERQGSSLRRFVTKMHPNQ